jgi:hypothetical protein
MSREHIPRGLARLHPEQVGSAGLDNLGDCRESVREQLEAHDNTGTRFEVPRRISEHLPYVLYGLREPDGLRASEPLPVCQDRDVHVAALGGHGVTARDSAMSAKWRNSATESPADSTAGSKFAT